MHKYTLYIIIGWFLIGTNFVFAKPKNTIPDSLQVLRFEVNNIPFTMQRVEGGVFIMGGTREQHREAISTDLPAHTVALNAYYIAHTEVTQALWQAVMPEWQFVDDWNNPNHPITNVSWTECQLFIQRLSQLTNMPFRLPTEAEWEFAARGGNQSEGYRFAGSNIADSVSWGLSNGGFRKHTVGLKKPNELGLYDMTGNVSEWCADWYAPYHLGTAPNPCGPDTGIYRVIRGGSYDNCQANSHISYRQYNTPEQATNYCGLRLAFTLSNEPTLQNIEEPALVRKIKIKNLRIKMLYVPGNQPYYISEEPINWRIWNKIMNQPNTENWAESVVEKSNEEWNKFLEKCRAITQEPMVFASEQERDSALNKNVISLPKHRNTKKKYWEKDIKSIQRHRKTTKKAQKWADLIGVTIKTTDDPILQFYEKKEYQPRWLVIR